MTRRTAGRWSGGFPAGRTRGPRERACICEAVERARGPRLFERSENMWGGLDQRPSGRWSGQMGGWGSGLGIGEEWVLIAPGFAQGFPHDSSRPPPSATGQYGLNVRAPFAAPRGFHNALQTPARCRAGQVSFFAHPPGVNNFLSFYHPMSIKAQQTFYHPSPQAGVPLGGKINA